VIGQRTITVAPTGPGGSDLAAPGRRVQENPASPSAFIGALLLKSLTPGGNEAAAADKGFAVSMDTE
jgi:hypothetical protein